jgi:glycosyltransferase involved in cell wall biosynthesis
MSDAFPRRGITKDNARICLGMKGHTLLFFGMVRRYKGLMTLIRALAQLDGMKVNCVVAGEFYTGTRAYNRAISRLQLQGRIKLIDQYIPDDAVELYFAAADAVVLPYTSASQSGIVQVAYGFERPVIASAVGGLPEVVKHGETGLLVPPGDAGELAGAIRKFYTEGMAESFAEAVRREAERISWKTVLQEVDALACNSEGAYL